MGASHQLGHPHWDVCGIARPLPALSASCRDIYNRSACRFHVAGHWKRRL